MSKDKDYQRLINAPAWRRLRREKLTKQPWCERCQAEGRLTPATEVHHISPVEDAPTLTAKAALMYDPHNLRSLCHPCHVRTHQELASHSRKHAKAKAKAQLEEFKRKYL